MGGSDQWGNIVGGIELGRRTDGVELFGLTTPLLTTASGAKMGKTAAGAVWLNPDMLSPYDYWQFWRNTEDADVGRFLKLFTELPLDEIGRLATLKGSELNEAKKVLATEATALRAWARRGGPRGRDGAHHVRSRRDRREPAHGRGSSGRARARPGRAQCQRARRLRQSTGEARRQIKGGGIKVNDEAVTDERRLLTPSDLTPEGVIKLSLGKKRHALIRPV